MAKSYQPCPPVSAPLSHPKIFGVVDRVANDPPLFSERINPLYPLLLLFEANKYT